jgi:hypothetical protein
MLAVCLSCQRVAITTVRLGICCDIMEVWCGLDASESGRKDEIVDVGGCSCEVKEGSANVCDKVCAACE